MNKREIKFRNCSHKDKICYEPFTIPEMFEEAKKGSVIAKDNELCQFTNLKDKNGKGKEVYEGDLIRACPNGYEPREIYEVVWDEERLEWGVKSSLGMITSLWTFDKDFEIVGNVFETPDFLKSSQPL